MLNTRQISSLPLLSNSDEVCFPFSFQRTPTVKINLGIVPPTSNSTALTKTTPFVSRNGSLKKRGLMPAENLVTFVEGKRNSIYHCPGGKNNAFI